MSASARTAQAGIGYSGFKSALAALALVVILAATIAIVALGVSKPAVTPATQAHPVPAPLFLDKGSRTEMNRFPAVPFVDRDKGSLGSAPYTGGISDTRISGGGWGPAAAEGIRNAEQSSGKGGHGTRIAQ